MIQRIQTLFLLIASGLLFSLFYNDFTYSIDGAIQYIQYTPFLVFTVVTFIVSIISICLFKYRMLQMRTCVYNMLILIAYQAWIAYMFFTRIDGTAFSITAVFPIVAGILIFIAFRYIARDEALVQSVNSLRRIHKNHKTAKK
ncbi:MAG: DUF4293 domain-containing protein [Bacteroidales bacterium]